MRSDRTRINVAAVDSPIPILCNLPLRRHVRRRRKHAIQHHHRQARADGRPATTADGTPIVWSDDNDAHIEGLLFEVGKNYKRKGQFQTFFKHHAAILSNGKLAVDSADSVHFITNSGRPVPTACTSSPTRSRTTTTSTILALRPNNDRLPERA